MTEGLNIELRSLREAAGRVVLACTDVYDDNAESSSCCLYQHGEVQG